MPRFDFTDKVELPVSSKKQYLLSLIPALGVFISFFTCIANIRKIKRSAILSWWIQSLLPILMFCVLCAMFIYVSSLMDHALLFGIFTTIMVYITLVGMAFAMIFVENKVIEKALEEAEEGLEGEQEDD